MKSRQIFTSNTLQDILYLILAIFSVSFGLKSFLTPNHFIDGGITGISLLVHELTNWNLSLLIGLLNLPFIIISYRILGKSFAIRTAIVIVGIMLCLLYVPFPELVHDKLLVATFGGFFVGLGSGLAMRGDSTTDGIEVLAMFTIKKTGFSVTEIILGGNILIFMVAIFIMDLQTGLYAMLTYFVAIQTTKYVIEGVEAYTGVTVISGESEIIKEALVMQMKKGITVYKGERGFMQDDFGISSECDILFTVVTRLEVQKLRNLIYEIDPKAFVFSHTIRETQGGILKQIIKH